MGDLNITSFHTMSRQLKLRHIYSLISEKPTKWVTMVVDLISKDLNRGILKLFLKHWTLSEVLLLYPSLPISS